MQVVNSNAVNRYGFKFSVSALTRNVYDGCLAGTPLLVAHDASRLIGWTHPFAVHIEPGLARLVSMGSVAQNKEEHNQLIHRFNHHIYKTSLEGLESETEYLKTQVLQHLKAQGLSQSFSGQEQVINVECLALVEPELAVRTFPKVFGNRDKYGLVSLKELESIGLGVFKIGDLAVFAHSFFRRNLFWLNSLNRPFLELLHNLDTESLSVKIALDPNMVGLASTSHEGKVELAYWWGPKFDDDITSIDIGVTHHEADEMEQICYGISATQFRWGVQTNQQDSTKRKLVFEAEELRDEPSADNLNRYGCRYAHSMVDKDSGEIFHLDGSIRAYTEEEMVERLDVDLAHAGRNTDYTKLWCCDGQIDIATWKALLANYFRDNYLVGEYLGGRDISKHGSSKPDLLTTQSTSVLETFLPYSMQPGMGIRVAVSYRPSFETQFERGHEVIPLDMVEWKTKSHYIESYGLELRKAFAKLGIPLHIPEEMQIISFKDMYANLPLVYHHQSCLPEGLQQTNEAIKMLVEAWIEKDFNMVFTYKISLSAGNNLDVCLSFLGHSVDMLDWLSHPLSTPPTQIDELHNWADEVSNYLDETWPNRFDTPPIGEVLKSSGILLIERRRIPTNWEWQVTSLPDIDVVIPEEDGELAELLHKAEVQLCLGQLVMESECTNCHQDYFSCDCSRILDNYVSQYITNAWPIGVLLTDRPG